MSGFLKSLPCHCGYTAQVEDLEVLYGYPWGNGKRYRVQCFNCRKGTCWAHTAEDVEAQWITAQITKQLEATGGK